MVNRVSPYDRIVVLRARQRLASHFQAQVYESMTSVVEAMEHDPDEERWAAEAAAAEIRVALRLTRRAADAEVAFALELQRRLPRVWEALVTGAIDVRRAKTFSHRTTHLPDAVARMVVDRVIESAGELTTGELRARLDLLCIEADPDGAEERYQSAVKTRRLVVEPSTSGTANLLGLDLAPHRVTAISRKINHLARSLRTKDETRTMDQLRADVYLDLLNGTHRDGTNTSSKVGGNHIHSDLDTLVGLAAHPGELNGYGPVVADIARQVAQEQQDTEWRWSITHPETGELLYDGITQRRPTTTLRRTVQARDTTCVFPGCRQRTVTSTISNAGPTAEQPQNTTSPPPAATTTSSKNTTTGPTSASPTAPTNGPPNSATPTPPAENRHSGSGRRNPRPSRPFTNGKHPERHRSLEGDQRAHGEWPVLRVAPWGIEVVQRR